jgi:poly(3-hydroxybutyrate) depolymerase
MQASNHIKSLFKAAAITLIGAALSACGGGGDTGDTRQAAQQMGPAVDIGESGAQREQPLAASQTRVHYIASGGVMRQYGVVKPEACVSNCPVVIDLHGFTSSGAGEMNASGIMQVAGADGAITVFPDGVSNSWNAGSGVYGACCGLAQAMGVNDVAFLRTMIAKIKVDYAMVDSRRIYVTGISNGCAMAQRFAAEASDLVAAAACTALYLLTDQTSLPRPINFTEIHGIQDSVVSYEQSAQWTGAQNNFKRWARFNNCTGTPTKTVLTAGSHVEEYGSCSGGVKVKLYSIKSDHVTYRNTDGIDVARITWDSLKDARLP